jgi:diacylglycerol kinase family enzyme
VAVGGDGTLHEVVNGLMFREDKKKIPIAFIPNGSGNDTCASIGVSTVEQGIDYLKQGDTIKLDLNRVFIDADSFEEVRDKKYENEQDRYAVCRYSIINAAVGFIAKCVHVANGYKSYMGSFAYTAAGLKCFFSGEKPDKYQFNLYNEVDGK